MMSSISEEKQNLLKIYVESIKKIYGPHLNKIILYGSYARGDFNEDSDIDIMILLDISDIEIKDYRHQLSDTTFDFNMDHNIDIKPIAKNEDQFLHWLAAYPFYKNIDKEGVVLYAA